MRAPASAPAPTIPSPGWGNAFTLSFPVTGTEPANATYQLVLSTGVVDNPSAVGTYSIANQFSSVQGQVDCPIAQEAILACILAPTFVSALPVPDVIGANAQQILTLTNPAGSSMPTSFAFTWASAFVVRDFGA